jgi:type II secretory pathway pseudopilin PulG
MMRLFHSAYTLVELLIALALSLLLLLGVAELFQHVGRTMNDTRSAMSASAHLNEVAMLLRQDLARISPTLATKPQRIQESIDDITKTAPDDLDGYLQIIEGPNRSCDCVPPPDPLLVCVCHPYVDENGTRDFTVGDVDDIIGFTTDSSMLSRGWMSDVAATSYRGMIRGEIAERDNAEIVWFVRGNTLYRRVRLIDDITRNGNTEQVFYDVAGTRFPIPSKENLDGITPAAGQFAIVEQDETNDGGPQRYDAVEDSEGNIVWTTLLSHNDLARRARRFGHDGIGLASNDFPHPLYKDQNAVWYYLRMPTRDESDFWARQNVMFWKTKANSMFPPQPEIPDLWEQPHFFPTVQDRKSGSLILEPNPSSNSLVGEDVVLTNVLSFDIKVWDSAAKAFVNLGEGTIGVDDWAGAGNQPELNHPAGLRVWDSWTREYKKLDGTIEPPPYDKPLKAIQITIRCFDPSSRVIKQVTVVHRFNEW